MKYGYEVVEDCLMGWLFNNLDCHIAVENILLDDLLTTQDREQVVIQLAARYFAEAFSGAPSEIVAAISHNISWRRVAADLMTHVERIIPE